MADSMNLTPRQRQIGMLAAVGLRNGEIAERLVLSHKTVEATLEAARERTGTRTVRHLTFLLGREARFG